MDITEEPWPPHRRWSYSDSSQFLTDPEPHEFESRNNSEHGNINKLSRRSHFEERISPVRKLSAKLLDNRLGGRSKRFWATMISLGLLTFITSVDGVIVASVLPIISMSLNASSEAAFWCGTGFLVSQAVVPSIYVSFSETFGRKVCVLLATGVFLVASILCATAC
jgi:hypothetical protein